MLHFNNNSGDSVTWISSFSGCQEHDLVAMVSSRNSVKSISKQFQTFPIISMKGVVLTIPRKTDFWAVRLLEGNRIEIKYFLDE